MDYHKSRTLALYRILLENTDEFHQMSMREIISQMSIIGYQCSEDSIQRYIKQLRYEMGVDIVSGRGRSASYFIGERVLSKEEIQLLIDAINASTVIGKSNSKTIIKKLKRLVSNYQSDELTRTVLTPKNDSRINRHILYNIDKLQEALNRNAQIEFEYMEWGEDKRLAVNGQRRKLNPWGLIWANERYYLYGYTIKRDENDIEERTYRVDKMGAISLINGSKRQGEAKFKKFDVGEYVSRRIDMFSGTERMVKVLVPNNLIGPFIDQFGINVNINLYSQSMVEIEFKAAVTDIFIGWLVGLRNVELIEPKDVRNKIREYLRQESEKYNK